ncbi:MAG: beta-ketoacyl synthase N-terminal-like domain-containing protein [Deltaproteobacteria bacterium]|nr:beta-ketoacyl synthase N-terminal-like domain-containing protein [Deltaproteobacteria bacterium]
MSPIAVVGRACLLPGASSPAALWDLVSNGRSAVSAVPAGRFGLDPDLVRGTPSRSIDKTWSTRGGYVTDVVGSDFPGGADVAALDPLFAWTLSCAHRALSDAGFDDGVPKSLRGGTVLGNLSFPTEAMTRLGETLALDEAWRAATGRTIGDKRDRFMSGLPALLVQKHLRTNAFAFCLDAACASSLYAIHLGVRALQAGRVDVVVAGAVNRADSLFLHVGFSALQALSTSGTPRPFDKSADGLVPAEGCAVVALMRLDDALATGRTIHAVITGSGLSNDGRSKNLLAPSSEGQVRALRAAWADAAVDPSTASLFECHATGTQTGDKAEVESLQQLLSSPSSSMSAPVPLGSLKSNIGHLITAAGAAGLIKVCEAFAHQELPPTINVSDAIDVVDGSRLSLQTELGPWAAKGVRRAGISAFGFGGNDAHLVVEEPPPRGRGAHSFTSPPVKVSEASLPSLAVTAIAVRIGAHTAVQAAFASETAPLTDVVVDTDGVRFPPNDLKECLAQQLLVFEAAREATQGLGDDALPRERTGIFIGMGTDVAVTTPGLRWRAEDLLRKRTGFTDSAFLTTLRDLAMPPMGASGVLGTMPNIPANRLSVQLDVRGPGFTISSEERSGLDALDVARALIASNEIDAALVGAVDACDDPRHVACREGKPADAAVVLVVMREERARALGLPVLGVLGDSEGAVTIRSVDVDDAVGCAHAASGLLAVATALASFGSQVVEVSSVFTGARKVAVKGPPRAWRDDVAVLFGPVGTTQTQASWSRFPAVASEVAKLFGDDAPAMLAGTAGVAGCERGLFSGSITMQARYAFLRDVLGVNARHHVGVSLGESNALVAAGAWRDPRALLHDTVASRLFVDDVAGPRAAVSAFWAARQRSELGSAWLTVVVRAPRARIEEALRGRDDVFATLWHTDDECAVAGSPAAVDDVVKQLGVAAAPLPDAPSVHGPVIAAVAERYRALHHRPTQDSLVTVWSHGVGAHGGALSLNDDACADAILKQASRAVDVPALLRQVWDAGVRTFVDVSPRGLVAGWCKRVLPDAAVIAVDGAPREVALRLLEAGLLDAQHFGRFWKERSEPARSIRVPAHRVPKPWPAPPARVDVVEKMTAAPSLPRLTALVAVEPSLSSPLPSSGEGPGVRGLSADVQAPVTHVEPAAPPVAANVLSVSPHPPAPSPEEGRGGGDDAILAAFQAHRAALLSAHQGFLDTASRGHAAFLQAQQTFLARIVGLEDAAPSSEPAPAPIAQPTTTTTAPAAVLAARSAVDVLFDRDQLVSLATDKLSKTLGPMFQRQDGFRRQVRMPRPPLLLADRVLSTTATRGVLEKGKKIVTATDVRADAWYLHEARVPAGVLIETGQADLLLISLMGVDFENKGERVYRLLGCDLTYTDHLPLVGQTLHHDIVIDGFATAAISATSEARIFFFHSETRAGDGDGPVLLTVKNGQAGFFTDEELLSSGGVLWKPEGVDIAAIRALPSETPALFTTKTALSRSELLAWSQGDAFACFGPGFEIAQTHVRTPRIDPPRKGTDLIGNPDGRFIDMLLIDRVTQLEVAGGPWGRGYLRAELNLSKDKWFYDGHFQDDPCMPGTIMFQGCLQVASTFLAAAGYTLARDGFRFEPRLGAEMPLRCRGQATPTSKHLVYELFVKAIVGGREPCLRCDILVTVDGLKSLHGQDIELALVADFPLTSSLVHNGAAPKRDGRDAIAPRSVNSPNAGTTTTGFTSLLSTGIGRPGAAFPGLYDVYDDGSPVARLPGPPYHFMSNVDDVSGPPMGSLLQKLDAAGTRAVVRYDVPDDAWYFREAARSQGRRMPFAVLLEVALQPCGWLSSYVGSTRTSSSPLKYRNLDGKAVQHKEVDPNCGALITTAKLTKSSASSGMIIQEFTFDLKDIAGDDVFSGSTVFGFFPEDALARQVGAGSTEAERARLVEDSGLPGYPVRFDDDAVWSRIAASKLALPLAIGEPTLLMLDRVDAAWRTPKGHLRVRTSKDVVVDDWFFKAHFFQDPVQPGSLGIEAMVQALQWIAVVDDAAAGMRKPRFESLALGRELVWKYRGQVVPRNKLIQVEVEVTDVVKEGNAVTLIADGALWVDGLKIYLTKGLALRVVDDA